jgi:hypothetical protein
VRRPKANPAPEQGKTFTGRVVIDDRAFVDCVFTGATLVYFGGAPPGFQGCRFEGVRWDFKSSALNTIGLLQAFSRPESGFRALFDEIFTRPDGEEATAPIRNGRRG